MQDTYESRFAEWQKAKFSPPPEMPTNPIAPSQVEMVSMRDGTALYTEVYLPPSVDAYPVVLIRSPYPFNKPSRNDKRPISRYQKAGYAVVYQLTRGQGQSEGTFRFLQDDTNDGYDAVQWIAEQSWCNGKIGMEGASYLGSTQLLAARAKPQALKCIMPTAFVGNWFQCFPFSHGVPNKGPYMQWHQVLDAERWDDMDVNYCDMSALEHPLWGPAFRKRPLLGSADTVLNGDKLANWRETMANPDGQRLLASHSFHRSRTNSVRSTDLFY